MVPLFLRWRRRWWWVDNSNEEWLRRARESEREHWTRFNLFVPLMLRVGLDRAFWLGLTVSHTAAMTVPVQCQSHWLNSITQCHAAAVGDDGALFPLGPSRVEYYKRNNHWIIMNVERSTCVPPTCGQRGWMKGVVASLVKAVCLRPSFWNQTIARAMQNESEQLCERGFYKSIRSVGWLVDGSTPASSQLNEWRGVPLIRLVNAWLVDVMNYRNASSRFFCGSSAAIASRGQ